MKTYKQMIAEMERPRKLGGGIERLESLTYLAVMMIAWGLLAFWGLLVLSA